MSEFIVPISGLPSISSLSEIQSANKAQASGKPGEVPFADFLQNAIQEMDQASQVSQTSMQNVAVGGSDDLHTSALAAVKSSTAVTYTAGLVSSVISSYKEIMQTQI